MLSKVLNCASGDSTQYILCKLRRNYKLLKAFVSVFDVSRKCLKLKIINFVVFLGPQPNHRKEAKITNSMSELLMIRKALPQIQYD